MLRYKLYLIILVVLFGWWLYFLIRSILDDDIFFILLGMGICIIHGMFISSVYSDYRKEKAKHDS